MPTSTYSGRIDFESTRHDEYEGVDTFQAAVYANNLAHGCDSSGQHFANWVDDTQPIVVDPNTSTDPFRMWRAGPFPIRIRPDGDPYRIRYRLRGATAGGTLNYYVAAHDIAVEPAASVDATGQAVATLATTSAILGWVGGGVLTLQAGDLPERSRETRATTAGEAATARFHFIYLSILGQNATDADATLSGFYAAEYIG